MKFLDTSSDIAKLEASVRNAFKWDWLDRLDDNGDRVHSWCRKIDNAGQAYCIRCDSILKYGSEGFKALANHAKTATHIKNSKCIRSSMSMSQFTNAEVNDHERPLDIVTRKTRQEVLVASFVAENSLSFSLAPKLVELAQTLGRDQAALKSLSLSRTTTSYKLKYGVAKTIKDKVTQTLQKTCFSLNIDESTSNAQESILAILVQFFCDKQNRVIVHHLASVKLETCSASAVYNEIVKIIETHSIPWNNLISVLMDSCNTMRGKKTGVETRLRRGKAPFLLDIDGDTCHTANNCAKKFTAMFENHLEHLFDDIYYDMKSASKRENFFKICSLLGMKKLKPLQRPEHRWIYLLTVINRIKELWDALLVFYFSYVKKEERACYLPDLEVVYEKRKVSASQRDGISELVANLRSQKLTKEAEARKHRIINGLFFVQQKTLLHMELFLVILPEFESYLKLFQSKTPKLHQLHTSMYELMRKFITFFMKPEVISKCKSYKDLLKLDVGNDDYHLPDSLLYVGLEAARVLNKMPKKHVISEEFKASLRKAYVLTSQYMVKKLPLGNSALISFTCLDPELRGKTSSLLGFEKLSSLLSHIFSESEKTDLSLEIRIYQTDFSITEEMSCSVDVHGNKVPRSLDEYWSRVFLLKHSVENKLKYQSLAKLVKACLTCFHGPLVESAFSFMDGIITDQRTSLKIDSLDAVQTVKYDLFSTRSTTCEKYGSDNPIYEPLSKDLLTNVTRSWTAYQQDLLPTAISSSVSSSQQCLPLSTIGSSQQDSAGSISATSTHLGLSTKNSLPFSTTGSSQPNSAGSISATSSNKLGLSAKNSLPLSTIGSSQDSTGSISATSSTQLGLSAKNSCDDNTTQNTIGVSCGKRKPLAHTTGVKKQKKLEAFFK